MSVSGGHCLSAVDRSDREDQVAEYHIILAGDTVNDTAIFVLFIGDVLLNRTLEIPNRN